LGKFIHPPPRGRDLQIQSRLQEAQGLEVPRCFLDERMRCITQFVHGCLSELVSNFDQVGISDWKDRTEKNVIVPK
jgi:hypothetical protein